MRTITHIASCLSDFDPKLLEDRFIVESGVHHLTNVTMKCRKVIETGSHDIFVTKSTRLVTSYISRIAHIQLSYLAHDII